MPGREVLDHLYESYASTDDIYSLEVGTLQRKLREFQSDLWSHSTIGQEPEPKDESEKETAHSTAESGLPTKL